MAQTLVNCDPRAISPETYKKLFHKFIETYEFQQISEIVKLHKPKDEYVSFFVNAHDVVHHDPALGFSLLNYPKLLLPLFEEAIQDIQDLVVKYLSLNGKQIYVKKSKCRVRIHSLPATSNLLKKSLGQVRSHDATSLLQVCGTIVRTGTVRMLEASKQYKCMNPKCGFTFKVTADPEQGNMLPQPRSCPSSMIKKRVEKEGGTNIAKQCVCTSTNLQVLEDQRDLVDYQEIKIQDQVENLSIGSVPRSLCIILEADLVDRFNAGDDVVVVGTIIRQWRPVSQGSRCHIDIALRANSVRMCKDGKDGSSKGLGSGLMVSLLGSNDLFQRYQHYWDSFREAQRVLTARNNIVRAMCPQLCGMYLVKLAVLLTLLGGSATGRTGGVRRRSESHLLLVGDPGTGKSQLLRFAATITPRSVLTTGIGTTGAGLTCTAVREGGDWCLEAGALVLASGGLCCIDEFSSIKEQDRASIHEAMEQQTISVAKAGMVVKLRTRTSIIAVANPKGSYDVTADLSINTAIASPLLSRFDLVLVLLDSPNKSWDLKMSTFILQEAIREGRLIGSNDPRDVQSGKSTPVSDGGFAGKGIKEGKVEVDKIDWNVDSLRQYISLARAKLQPRLGREAQVLLMRYYQQQRMATERAVSRTTIRLLESLVRLSEAHAKLMFRAEVTLQDAIVAIGLMELTTSSTSVLDVNATLHSDFPNDAEKDYFELEAKVFSNLHYSRLELTREVESGDVKDEYEDLFEPEPVETDASQPETMLQTSHSGNRQETTDHYYGDNEYDISKSDGFPCPPPVPSKTMLGTYGGSEYGSRQNIDCESPPFHPSPRKRRREGSSAAPEKSSSPRIPFTRTSEQSPVVRASPIKVSPTASYPKGLASRDSVPSADRGKARTNLESFYSSAPSPEMKFDSGIVGKGRNADGTVLGFGRRAPVQETPPAHDLPSSQLSRATVLLFGNSAPHSASDQQQSSQQIDSLYDVNDAAYTIGDLQGSKAAESSTYFRARVGLTRPYSNLRTSGLPSDALEVEEDW